MFAYCVCLQCFPFCADLTPLKLPNWVVGNIYFLNLLLLGIEFPVK